MTKFKKFVRDFINLTTEIARHHVAAYSAQSAYFFMLSLIPIILLLLTLVQFTPVTKADVMTAVFQVFPGSINTMLTSIVNQVYNQSTGIIPITVIVALWSAGKGVLALTNGLNTIYSCPETRNYVYLRLRSTVYTVVFIMMLIIMLVLSVFGNSINTFIVAHIPLAVHVADILIKARGIIMPAILVIVLIFCYKYLPNSNELVLKKQLPGAVFAAVGWMLFSWIFSVYVDIFKGFQDMYGSLTTIVLIMLWMYFCMYCILLGGEINMRWSDIIFEDKEENKEDTNEGAKI